MPSYCSVRFLLLESYPPKYKAAVCNPFCDEAPSSLAVFKFPPLAHVPAVTVLAVKFHSSTLLFPLFALGVSAGP